MCSPFWQMMASVRAATGIGEGPGERDQRILAACSSPWARPQMRRSIVNEDPPPSAGDPTPGDPSAAESGALRDATPKANPQGVAAAEDDDPTTRLSAPSQLATGQPQPGDALTRTPAERVIAERHAQVLVQATRLVTQLQAALTSRSTIDQAMGILISRTGCPPDQALDRLRQISQNENQNLRTVAHYILDEAIRRSQARHSGPPES